jgi:hypothetical protein
MYTLIGMSILILSESSLSATHPEVLSTSVSVVYQTVACVGATLVLIGFRCHILCKTGVKAALLAAIFASPLSSTALLMVRVVAIRTTDLHHSFDLVGAAIYLFFSAPVILGLVTVCYGALPAVSAATVSNSSLIAAMVVTNAVFFGQVERHAFTWTHSIGGLMMCGGTVVVVLNGAFEDASSTQQPIGQTLVVTSTLCISEETNPGDARAIDHVWI